MKQLIPQFPLPDGFSSADDYLKDLVNRGTRQRYGLSDDTMPMEKVAERIDRELDVISELGCADYFLVLWDALRHARQKGIAIGPGRGSAAGSIVNYCLGITQVDPLEYGLLFERFLNTNYSSCADIDIDGDEYLREEMLCYLPKRYGKNHVALIANHVCGIVISLVDVTQHFDTTSYTNRIGEELPVILAKAEEIDEAGFLRFDFLHLPVLSIISNTIKFVEQRRNKCIKNIPLDDTDTLKFLCGGQTASIFQFDSEGIGKDLRELQPTSFSDLVALNALYRPGAMDWLPDFIARKCGERPATNPLPAVEKCLKETYGIMVYQEQIMQLAHTLADFTPNESDRLRKALGKRKDVTHFKKLFIERSAVKGYEREPIEMLWADMERGGCYLFNKSHTVCYTLIGYQTAYLKAHFPTEYMAARLHYDLNNQGELSDYLFDNNYTDYIGNDLDEDLQECHRMGIRVMGLDRTHAANRVTISQDGTISCGQTACFLQTGIKSIDDSIGGLPLGSITLIAGRPAMGKTSLSFILAKCLAADNRIPIAYFSLELSAVQLVRYFIPMLSGGKIDEDASYEQLTPSEKEWLDKQIEYLKNKPLYIDDTAGLQVSDFKTKAKWLVCEKGVKLIIVDYLQLMRIEGKFTDRREEVNAILSGIRDVAKELNVAVVVNTQVRKSYYYIKYGKSRVLPSLDDINEYCDYERFADVMCVLHRPGIYREESKDVWDLIVARDRFGYTTTIDLMNIFDHTQI